MLNNFVDRFKAMFKDESGLAAVEYGLLAAGIAIGLYTIIAGMGSSLRDIYTAIAGDLGLGAWAFWGWGPGVSGGWAPTTASPRGVPMLLAGHLRLKGGVMKHAAPLLRDGGGSVAIEFAIVVALLLTILFGIVAFGFQFAARIALSYAVAEAGRSAVAGLTSEERQRRAEDAVDRVLASFAPLVDPAKAVVVVSSEGETQDGEVIKIAITYDDNRFDVFPFVPHLNGDRAVETVFLVADPSG
jgi:Flp pilus assembly protein TadG